MQDCTCSAGTRWLSYTYNCDEKGEPCANANLAALHHGVSQPSADASLPINFESTCLYYAWTLTFLATVFARNCALWLVESNTVSDCYPVCIIIMTSIERMLTAVSGGAVSGGAALTLRACSKSFNLVGSRPKSSQGLLGFGCS